MHRVVHLPRMLQVRTSLSHRRTRDSFQDFVRQLEKKASAEKAVVVKLTNLVKEKWLKVQCELGPPPPIALDDSGKHLALTASKFKYWEKGSLPHRRVVATMQRVARK